MLSVTEISTEKDFHDLKDKWNELLSKSESDNIFLTWEWLYNWWNVYGNEKELKILLAMDDQKLVGIVPFYLCRNTHQLRFLGSAGVGSDYLDFILLKGYEHEVFREVFNYLNRVEENWQCINITDIADQSKCVNLMKQFYRDKFHVLTKKQSICPYIKLPDTYELYLRSLSSSMRYNIQRKRRKFEDKLEGRFLVVSEKNELDRSIRELMRLNLSRTKVKNIKSPFGNELFTEFHKNFIEAVFDQGWVRLCFLKVRDEFIACVYIFKYGPKYYYYQSGFDTKWAALSPGYILFSYCIENAMLEGMDEFDFLQGEESFKYDWANGIRKNLRICIYKKNLRNNIRYLSEKYKMAVKSGIKNLLKTGVDKINNKNG